MVVLYPECHTEKYLCEYLKFTKGRYQKCDGKPDVINKIQASKAPEISIGIVDEDPMKNQHRDYILYQAIDTFVGMRLLKRRDSSRHYLIEFKGEFEPWIKEINKKAKIDPEKHNIIMNRLHEYTGPNMPENYKRFLKAIFTRYPELIKKIEKWIAECGKSK